MISLLGAVSKITSKTDFIHNNCELCGKRDMSLSLLRLMCGYGSLNDGEDITLNICGECADRIYQIIQKES